MVNKLLFKIIEKFSIIRKFELYDFFKSIVVPFIIQRISCFFGGITDKKIIVMGAYSGRFFIDNTKYLFKFLNKYSNHMVFWIAKDDVVIEELRKKNFNVLPFYSLRTIKLLRRAKYIFLTHGYPDIPPIKISPNSIVVLTWHGTPIKKINTDLEESSAYSKIAYYLNLNLRFNDYVDYLLTPTKKEKEHQILCKAFFIPPKKILDLGYPRNDILFKQDKEFLRKLRKKYEIGKGIKKIFLYAPTFRKDLVFRFPLSDKEIKDLNFLLGSENAILLIKAHMFEQQKIFKTLDNFKIVKSRADIQELLLLSDALITDYSSMIFDYLLINRPILLFTYDLETYKKERGMYYEFEKIAPGPLIYHGLELIDAIKNLSTIKLKYDDKRKKIRDRFNKYLDGKSTERVLKFFNISYNK